MTGSSAIVELSHDVYDGLVTYPGIPAPVLGTHLSFDDSAGHYAAGTEFSIASLTLAANTGTYLDTPRTVTAAGVTWPPCRWIGW